MLKREFTQLAVYDIERDMDTLPLTNLRGLYLTKTSDIIYVTKNHKLYGIICMSDVLRHNQSKCMWGQARINKVFTSLTGMNIVKAYEIFHERQNIHKIPIINEKEELLGDYSCWDDILFVERNQERLMKKDALKKILEPYKAIYIIEPSDNKDLNYSLLLNYLGHFQIQYFILTKEDLDKKLSDEVLCIFLSEDERRGTQCLYGFKIDQYGILLNNKWKVQLITYAYLLNEVMHKNELENLKIVKPANLSYDKIDQKTTILFNALKQQGVKCFCLYPDERVQSEFSKQFKNEISERVKINPMKLRLRLMSPLDSWPKMDMNKKHYEEFYAELSQIDDYKNGIAQNEILNACICAFEHQKNLTGQYFNAKNGRRITCFQPKEYVGTVYLLGPCMTIGAFSEDQYTIASFLQKKLLSKGYNYRVENYGSIIRNDSEVDSRLSEIDQYHTNDIIIIFSQIGEVLGVPGMSLEKIFEKNCIPSTWVTNGYMHCNHKVNQLTADSILEMIEPCLLKQNVEEDGDKEIQINIPDIMKDYVQRKYLNQYFHDFHGDEYCTVGAIVMNCNPFSKGHRYLVEHAVQQTDFLIVFVVEEDESIFPFEERYKMISEGIKDLDNIMVVPSGEFIISNNTFQEYFMKEEHDINPAAIMINAEYDINIFADYIAAPLHITHRFAGEEPQDKVTQIYNETMSRILPQKGITFVEIPRIQKEGEVVSASRIRKYLQNEEYDQASALMPETTKQYLAL